jgi:murein L,D-transpeptidase YafK
MSADKTFRAIWVLGFVLAGALVCAAAWGGSAAAPGADAKSAKVDRIVIEKAARTMTLMSEGKAIKTYKVALGGQPKGANDREGDHKTPEGIYSVAAKIAHSKFHLGLPISYPNAADRERARKLGGRPGGAVEIHGLGEKYGWVGAAHRATDWTDGCIAVTNEEIDEIYPMVEVGTVVEIRP